MSTRIHTQPTSVFIYMDITGIKIVVKGNASLNRNFNIF